MQIDSSYIPQQHSQNEYRRMGDRIRQNPTNPAPEDLCILQDLRLTYKEPLAIVFKAIEKIAYGIDRECICTYRVKRIESIISKLVRFPNMQVQRAEDIAGCRVIMRNTDDVYRVVDKIQNGNMPFIIKGKINDYIESPKESGYRSVHINVVLKDGDNRRIEIQIRTREHHNWATLVEISDLIFKAKLKEYGPKQEPDLYRLHQLLAKSDEDLTFKDKYDITEITAKYKYIGRVGTIFDKNYLVIRKKWNEMRLKKMSFFLISTGEDGSPDFEGFTNFEQAEAAYFDLYNNNDGNLNIVLTHVKNPDFSKISIAYSNYILTYNSAITRILNILSEAVVYTYRHYRIGKFREYYKHVLCIVARWYRNTTITELTKWDEYRSSYKKRSEWSASIKSNVMEMNRIMSEMENKLKNGTTYFLPHYYKKKMFKKFMQAIAQINQERIATIPSPKPVLKGKARKR